MEHYEVQNAISALITHLVDAHIYSDVPTLHERGSYHKAKYHMVQTAMRFADKHHGMHYFTTDQQVTDIT